MSIPDFQTLMLPVLREAATGEKRIGDVVEHLADQFTLSPEERSHLLPSGRQTTFANRVHWAKSYLGKAGLVELTRRAHFQITPRGHELLAQTPARIDIKFLTRFSEFQSFRFIDQDPLGLDRIYVQAKRYSADNNVGASAIRDFFGSLDRF